MKKLVIFFIILLSIQSTCAFAFDIPNFKKNTHQEIVTDETTEKAKVFYAQNEIDKAFNILSNKPEANRTDEDWLLLGNILQDKEDINGAIYMFKKAIETNPKFYKAHYNLGYIYLIQEKPNMALEEFKKSVKYKDDFAYGYYNIGCSYLKLKQYANARYNFFKALDLKADEPMIYYNLAYTFKMLNKEKQAQTYLDLYNKIMERK